MALNDTRKKEHENNEGVDLKAKPKAQRRQIDTQNNGEPEEMRSKSSHQLVAGGDTGHRPAPSGVPADQKQERPFETHPTDEVMKNRPKTYSNSYDPDSEKNNWKPVKWKNVFVAILIILIPVTVFIVNKSSQNVKDNQTGISEQKKDTVLPKPKKPDTLISSDPVKDKTTRLLMDSAVFDPRERIIQFLEAENSIASDADIKHILTFYTYPMGKNFKYTSVSREHLYNIYTYSYLKKFLYHKISGYENNIKVIPLESNRTRVEVTFQFETSVNPDGANKTTQQVSNAYVFNSDGKIESIGLITNKDL